MNQLFTNNAYATVSGGLTNGATTLTLDAGTGSRFPSPTGGDFFLLTLFEKDISSTEWRYEIVKVTARTADTLTIVRDYEGTVGVSGGYTYPSAPGLTIYCELRWTAAGGANTLQRTDNLASLASASTARTNLGLGDSAVKNVGTGATNVSAGDHTHTGVYEPADATILKSAAIGVTVQGYDSNTAKYNATTANFTGTLQKSGNAVLTSADKGAANGVATLDSGSKIPSGQLPSIAITSTYTVASQVDQLALTVQEGDVAIRTDLNKSYIHNGGVAGTMADWTELLSPTTGAIGSSGFTMSTAKLLGRYSASTGAIQEITVSTGLSLDGSGNLTASGGVTTGKAIAMSMIFS